MELLDLNNLVKERLDQLQENSLTLDPDSNVTYRFHPSLSGAYKVRANPHWLAQAFDGLVGNAIEAMDNSSTKILTIITEVNNKGVDILISDTGKGISEEVRRHLFEEPIKKPPGARGAGMGLLLAQTIIQTFSGEIRVGPTGPSGTTMIISLPVERQESKEVKEMTLSPQGDILLM
ncbi:MAG: HAMP domain-containing histidine kinase [Deltaproteobacteria bacterium]|nr:HAMP domain-containing histidine kinase [Deltaproteobacteria bacterium]